MSNVSISGFSRRVGNNDFGDAQAKPAALVNNPFFQPFFNLSNNRGRSFVISSAIQMRDSVSLVTQGFNPAYRQKGQHCLALPFRRNYGRAKAM